MTATANPNQQSPDLDSLRSTGGADIPENRRPRRR
jgi:hypothetical protein